MYLRSIRLTALFLVTALSIVSAQQSAMVARSRAIPQRFSAAEVQAGTALTTWAGQIVYRGKTYHYTMVGTNPAAGSQTTTVPVYIVPLKFTFSDGSVFDASTNMINETFSATQAVVESPIFQSAPFSAGSVNLGNTQYIDAFQRANFWNSVSANQGYHVLLGSPTILPTQAFNVPQGSGKTSAGPVAPYTRGTVSAGFLDKTVTPQIFQKFPQITPNAFTIFLTYNVFPAGAYGFHDVFGSSPASGLTYSYVSYLDPYTQAIDADISTLAHEVGEWLNDPYVSNKTPCGILEVGDPLNTAIFDVNLNGRVWHPQDLAMIGYFYQTPVPSVNGWLTFRNTYSQPCANGS